MSTRALSGAPIQLVIFDLMGTLIVDDGSSARAYIAALTQAGLQPDTPRFAEALTRIDELRGRPPLVVLIDVLGDPVVAEEATWAFDDSILTSIKDFKPFPGADAVLRQLAEQQILIAATTGFTPEVRKAVLAHCQWSETFDEVLSVTGTKRGHPAPDLLLEAILSLKIDSVAQVAIVGDSAPDLEAGSRAGAGLVVGVCTGGTPRAKLKAAPHTHLLDSVAGLIDVLEAPRTKGARRTSDR